MTAKKLKRLTIRFLLISLLVTGFICSASPFKHSFESLANSIYLAEGGSYTKYPYGIKTVLVADATAARKVCLNTIRHRYQEWTFEGERGDFVVYLGSFYSPTNKIPSLSDNWVRNVNFFLRKNLTTFEDVLSYERERKRKY